MLALEHCYATIQRAHNSYILLLVTGIASTAHESQISHLPEAPCLQGSQVRKAGSVESESDRNDISSRD